MPTQTTKTAREQRQELILWEEYAATRAPELREQLLRRYSGLVVHLARKLAGNSQEPLEDLVQEGYLGLLRAIDRYDPSQGTAFSTFAFPAIKGAMQNYLRDRGKLVREPASLQALRAQVRRASEELAETGSYPSAQAIAEHLGILAKSVERALGSEATFEQPISAQAGQGEAGTDLAPEQQSGFSIPDQFTAEFARQMTLHKALGRLTAVEREIVERFFYDDLTQREIARDLGRSCGHVSKLHRSALAKLKAALVEIEQEEAAGIEHAHDRSQGRRAAPVVDQETGLFSSAHFRRCLLREVERTQRGGRPFCLALLRLDGGASRRKADLRKLVGLVRQNTRIVDQAFRLSGWTIAMLLAEQRFDAVLACERIRELVSQRPGNLTVSVGVVEFPEEGASASELLRCAHAALAWASGQGGNHVGTSPQAFAHARKLLAVKL